eukprot:3824661-Prymnesium_polylepis.1
MRRGTDSGWDFCAAVDGVVSGTCYGHLSRRAYAGTDTANSNRPATGELFDWGHSGNSYLAYSCPSQIWGIGTDNAVYPLRRGIARLQPPLLRVLVEVVRQRWTHRMAAGAS